MNITINYFGQLAEISGSKEASYSLEKATINGLFEQIDKVKPEITKKIFAVFVNNKKVSNYNETLNVNDVVCLMPPFAGG